MFQPWQIRVVHLLEQGARAEAIEFLRSEVAGGNPAASVRLARMGDEAGLSREEVDRIIDAADRTAPPQDEASHWELSRAYDQSLGSIPYEERPLRSLHHLERYAELGNDPIACTAVARIWAQGGLGFEANAQRAAVWYGKAIAAGNKEAEYELRQLRP